MTRHHCPQGRQHRSGRLATLLLSSLLALPALALEGKEIPKPAVDDLNLYMPNSMVQVTLENKSKTGKLPDFLLSIQNYNLSIPGMTGVLHCGQHPATAVRTAPHPHSGSNTFDGAAAIHFGFVGNNKAGGTGPLFTLKNPDIAITTYERANKLNVGGYQRKFDGKPFTLNIPVGNLVKAGNLGSLDIQAEFTKRMEDFIAKGGSKMDFLRNNQQFEMQGHVTLEAACFSQVVFKAFHTKAFTVKVSYLGDKSLKYQAAVPTAGGGIQMPLQVDNATLAVNLGQKEAACPFDLTAQANVTFNQSPKQPMTYHYRFIENGKANAKWITAKLVGSNNVQLQHTITISKPEAPAPQLGSVKANAGQQPAQLPNTLKAQQGITLEVKTTDNNLRRASASYSAKCKDPVKATFKPKQEDTLPDLSTRTGLHLGNKQSAWGGSILLTDNDLQDVTARGCKVRYRYDVVNLGQGQAGESHSRLVVNGQPGDTVKIKALAPNQSQPAAGHVLLPSGTYTVSALIDVLNAEAESNEANVFSTKVTAPEKCGGSVPRVQ